MTAPSRSQTGQGRMAGGHPGCRRGAVFRAGRVHPGGHGPVPGVAAHAGGGSAAALAHAARPRGGHRHVRGVRGRRRRPSTPSGARRPNGWRARRRPCARSIRACKPVREMFARVDAVAERAGQLTQGDPSVSGTPAIVTPVDGESTAISFTKIVPRGAHRHSADAVLPARRSAAAGAHGRITLRQRRRARARCDSPRPFAAKSAATSAPSR